MSASFARPVTVLVGLGLPRPIQNPGAALAFLLEQPLSARDEAYEATVATCRDALAGRAEMAEAYDIVCAYARRRGMYLEDAFVDQQPVDTGHQLAA